ncbi:ATP-dependent helicase [Sulfuriroseicoccus oceanibius]|uniref:DNA 3'-5' helicase n=1 Tax=Sulfuriroseicoccus oceanibius TaxID=2707525 RepID=A0A6B3L8Y7_9BACT|nr:ATP-dependent helicase [Sulfuriroseicoccus oceanibius]QQL45910.1 ATP-dependent helicase [Sulfuriroseicoccus oceanibius]
MARKYEIKSSAPANRTGIDFRAELNDDQYAAVTSRPGPSLVIAGAGSGKTRTLTYRVAYLLDNHMDPRSILLLTFTNKASKEMLERVKELVPFDLSNLWGGTFHSIGNRILRKHADLIGLGRNFSILDRDDQKSLMKAAIQKAGIDTKAVRFPKTDPLIDLFSYSTNTMQDPREVLQWRYSFDASLHEDILKVGMAYEQLKRESNAADFDDLLYLCYRMFKKNPDVLARYQERFRFILVDEYQDTNLLQAALIDQLAGKHKSLMVVGDDAQSIYSWRGANFENIIKFTERYPKAKTYKIETNYRSVPEVLQAANACISNNRKQFAKVLQPARKSQEAKPVLAPVLDLRTQSQFVAQRVQELNEEEGVPFEEIAILYRAHFHSMEIQMEFTRRGIPFRVTSGLRFFEQAHIKDVAAFMRLAVNPRDAVSFKRLVLMLPGIGERSADKLWREWAAQLPALDGEKLESFGNALKALKPPKKAASAWQQFADTVDELAPGGEPATPTQMIFSVVEGCYDEYARNAFTNYDQRRQDLQQLQAFAEGMTDVEELLTQLALMGGVDVSNDRPAENEDHDVVTLSTVHQAKGLEWDVVFAVGLADGKFPNERALDADDPDTEEEERRLFYVTLTRAKTQLYLTYPQLWSTPHQGSMPVLPSRFIQELDPDLFDTWQIGSSAPNMWYDDEDDDDDYPF